MKILQFFFIAIAFFSGSLLHAQTLDPQSFRTTGTARALGAHCFELTSDQVWQGGTLWYKKAISLDEPFEMEMDLKFGCKDNGADGMVFIFHPSLKNGFQGEGMGFGGLKPAFGIEMDTYENFHLDDPNFDHLALIKNGRMHHNLGITLPTPLLPGKKNIEDCQAHRIKITWQPSDHNLKVYIDGGLRLNTNYDIIGKIFYGNPQVYWGISSATGGSHNQHLICLEKLDFNLSKSFDEATKTHLLGGQDYTLKDVDFLSGKTDLQELSYDELDRLVSLLKAQPKFDVFINGHTDNIGSASKNKALSKKRAEKIAKYLIEKGIDKARIQTRGFGESQPKVNNDTPENREINRRVEVFMIIKRA